MARADREWARIHMTALPEKYTSTHTRVLRPRGRKHAFLTTVGTAAAAATHTRSCERQFRNSFQRGGATHINGGSHSRIEEAEDKE